MGYITEYKFVFWLAYVCIQVRFYTFNIKGSPQEMSVHYSNVKNKPVQHQAVYKVLRIENRSENVKLRLPAM